MTTTVVPYAGAASSTGVVIDAPAIEGEEEDVVRVKAPTFHADQVRAFMMPGRFKAVRCGRRWGKTALGLTIACEAACAGESVGWFANEYKFLAETYTQINEILEPVRLRSNQTAGVIRLVSGGRIDFWSLENENAGRSRKYHKVILDEAAFTKPKVMLETWRRSIRPTLLDYRGSALVLSNTNGVDPDNFFWQICNQPQHGFVQYHAPTHRNPYLPAAELVALERDNHPLVFLQEYKAEFVDFSGVAFFSKDKMLVNGEPVAAPPRVDTVFAIVDTAVKTGKENDGTAVIYFALHEHAGLQWKLTILDWETTQIEGDLLQTWLPTVFQNVDALARKHNARMGSIGTYIEDKSTGMVLLQHAARNNWPATAIDSKLTAVGKDERAISVSGYVYRGEVKFSIEAFHKVTMYKETSRNHLEGQVCGFRIGDKTPGRDDDLLDCFCYGVAIALGDSGGF